MSMFELTSLKSIGDTRGTLTVIEGLKDLSFEIKRLYYLTNLDANTPRGFHAHFELTQFAICLSGSFDMLFDDGYNKETYKVDNNCEGVLIPPMIWHEMHNFSNDCILLVLASAPYDEDDYIREYKQFCKHVKENK